MWTKVAKWRLCVIFGDLGDLAFDRLAPRERRGNREGVPAVRAEYVFTHDAQRALPRNTGSAFESDTNRGRPTHCRKS